MKAVRNSHITPQMKVQAGAAINGVDAQNSVVGLARACGGTNSESISQPCMQAELIIISANYKITLSLVGRACFRLRECMKKKRQRFRATAAEKL